jgi:5'(3')-deoxyribonucleotidase
MDHRKVIVWDVDDVLNNLTYEWFKEYAGANSVKISYEQLKSNPPVAELEISLQSYLSSLDNFRQRRMNSMRPSPEVLAWFHSHGADYRHVALTAVPAKFSPLSAEWVLRHFGLWFRSFHFVPSFRANEEMIIYDESKADLLRKIGKVDYFIDDNEKNVSDVVTSGVDAMIFPRPWNSAAGVSVVECLKNIK